MRREGEGRLPRAARRWLGAQGRDGVGCQPMSQRFPSQPSSQMHCQGSTHSPLTQPGKVTHWSHRGPCQPGWHLWGGWRWAHMGVQECRGSSGCLLWSQFPLGISVWYHASRSQETNTSHLNGTPGSLRARGWGGALHLRSGLHWSQPASGSLNTPTSESAEGSHGCPLPPALSSPSLPPPPVFCGGEEAVCRNPATKPLSSCLTP